MQDRNQHCQSTGRSAGCLLSAYSWTHRRQLACGASRATHRGGRLLVGPWNNELVAHACRCGGRMPLAAWVCAVAILYFCECVCMCAGALHACCVMVRPRQGGGVACVAMAVAIATRQLFEGGHEWAGRRQGATQGQPRTRRGTGASLGKGQSGQGRGRGGGAGRADSQSKQPYPVRCHRGR